VSDRNVKGMASLTSKLIRLKKAVDAQTAKELYLSGLRIEEHAKESIMEGGKTGRVYKKGKKGKTLHRASAPGEAPANDTGRLVNSIRTEAKGNGKTVHIKAGGGSKAVKYAVDLEFGTEKMAPRPFMRPALKKAKPEIEKLMRRAVKDATDTVTKR
jgi:HK97 gp10 family phage protein